ncbi:MAG: hypothetical protein E6Z65_07970 [Finegoldia magna]|nr:hypothetical protein [Finegoldia magna]
MKESPNVAIIVPKETRGAYIDNLAEYKFKKQREFLINKKTKLKKIYKDSESII